MKMKSTLTVISLFALTFLLINNAAGPGETQDEDRTGSPLSSGSCNTTDCHDDGSFNPSVQIELLKDNVAVNKYLPGETYEVKVTITAGTGIPSGYGFQAVALRSSNNGNTGSWGTPPAGVQKITLSNGRTYVEHSEPKTGSNFFEVEWTAPAVGIGNINIYAAGNAVNLNNESTGDGANTVLLTLEEDIPISVKTEQQILDFSIFPNPVQEVLNLKIGSRYAEKIEMNITDVNGKIVQMQKFDLAEGLNEENINVNSLAKGLYLIRLINEHEVATQTMLKM